jgi:DNA repair protein RecN (Recombination protein N)
MLTELRIKNFAIIEALTLPLGGGFNVLSGETGAGKSIIVGALGLLLGERGNADLVRTGADRATVEGVFDIGDRPELAALLDARGIEVDEGQVVLKREIALAGRSRAWVNNSTVTTAVLADVGRSLVNLHGQHEAQTLLDGESQRRILDAFGGAGELAAVVRVAFEALAEVRREAEELAARRADAEKRADYLRHVAAEIEAAALRSGEDVRLDDEARRLEHAEELRTSATGIGAELDGEGESVLARLAAIQRALATIRRIDPSLDRLQELYDSGYYAIEELARAVDAYAGAVELDPERLADVQRRRDLVFRLIKKYGGTLDEVIDSGRRARAELDLIDSASFDLAQLTKREAVARSELLASAGRLTAARADAADRLAKAVDAVLPELGMSDGRFAAELMSRAEPGAHGGEDVEFRVALNVGHDMRPLARVASGGELSRVMLALKTILARVDGVPTLVFDEVDAGIGGRVGLQVGEKLRRVAEHTQVFAITHLPQIAARAHHHILVSKGARGGVTTADVTVLGGDERVDEIARMLGGDPEREVSRAHARELLATTHSAGLSTTSQKGGDRGGSRPRRPS